MNCTPTTITLQPYSYTPTKKVKTLEEQQKEFVRIVQEWVNKNPNKYPSWFLNEFVSKNPDKGGYWNTVPDGKSKTMYFLLPKKDRNKWSTGGRLAYAHRTFYKFDKRWNLEEKKEAYKAPIKSKINYSPINYEAKRSNVDQSIGEVMGAGERVKKGWAS